MWKNQFYLFAFAFLISFALFGNLVQGDFAHMEDDEEIGSCGMFFFFRSKNFEIETRGKSD